MAEFKNNYPTVMIHGLSSWGAGDELDKIFHYWGFSMTRDLISYLRRKGYEVYNPSTGPFNSAWDRSCEMYAQIMGGTVDYGKVHSEKYGHARYGRTYEKGLIEDWGKGGDHQKINIIGHSFGGPTVIAFANLMAEGCQEEIDGTPADELSPLFEGGHADMIHTVTTLAGVNNGTTLASFFTPKGMGRIETALLSLACAVSESGSSQYFDFMVDHWGMQPKPEDMSAEPVLHKPSEFKDQMERFKANRVDNIGYEMQIEVWQDICKKHIRISDKIYYFARISLFSKENAKGKHITPSNKNVMCYGCSFITGGYTNDKLRNEYGVDETWFPNDGFVNVKGQMGPFHLPSAEWAGVNNAKPGVWYNMTPEYRNHLSWAGISIPKKQFYAEYKQMIDMFRTLPDG